LFAKNSTKILVSFCNVFPRGLALGIFDFQNNNFQWIDISGIKDKLRGVTGTSYFNDQYFILTQNEQEGTSGFSVLNKDFNLEHSFTLQNTKDAHFLIPFENGFLVTDTKRNRINKITFSKTKKLEETEFWKYNDDTIDTVHINSIAHTDNRIFVALFDKKPEYGTWRDAKSGKIIEIISNKIIFQNLYHPHSLITIDDELYCLESGTGLVHKFSKNDQHEVILDLKGYLRGITFDENFFYIGASAHRRKSRSRGTPNAPISSKTDDIHSWIYRIDRKTLEYEKKDLTFFGSEIFDFRVIADNYNLPSSENPIMQRMWKYEDEDYSLIIKEKEKQLGELDFQRINQLREKDIQLADKKKRLTILEDSIKIYQNMITEIHQSFVFRMLRKYDNSIGKLIPLKPKKYLPSTKSELSEDEYSLHIKQALTKIPLKKKDVICFPIINWNYRYQRPQHILKQFSTNGHRVFYLTTTPRTLKKPFEIKPIDDNIYEIELNSPGYFDIYKDKFDESFVLSLIKSFEIMKKELKLDPICLVQFPTWSPFVIQLKKKFGFKIVFDVLDDFHNFPNVIKERKNEEELLVKNSDLIIVTSSPLLSRVKNSKTKTLFLPNAGEYNHFSKLTTNDVLKYKKPIVGYFGSIAEWFDTDLIEFLAKKKDLIQHSFS